MTIFREAADTKRAKRCHRVSMAANCTLLAAWLTACASPQYNYSPNLENFSIPAVGSINTVAVGENLLAQGVSATSEAIFVAKEISIDHLHRIPAGHYLKTGSDKKYETFHPLPVERNHRYNNKIFALLAPINSPKLCAANSLGAMRCKKTSEITRKYITIDTEKTFQQTLIYNGRINNEIKISYRESAKGFARPAFGNDATYDTTISPIIAYKGARIEVIQADNEKITYKVLSNFVDSDQRQ